MYRSRSVPSTASSTAARANFFFALNYIPGFLYYWDRSQNICLDFLICPDIKSYSAALVKKFFSSYISLSAYAQIFIKKFLDLFISYQVNNLICLCPDFLPRNFWISLFLTRYITWAAYAHISWSVDDIKRWDIKPSLLPWYLFWSAYYNS